MGHGLAIAGGILQVAGVLIVVRQIRANLRSAAAYRRRPIQVRVRMVGTSTMVGELTVTTGREPSLEERLVLVEEAVKRAGTNIREAKAELRKEWQEDLSNVLADITAGQREEDDALGSLVLRS